MWLHQMTTSSPRILSASHTTAGIGCFRQFRMIFSKNIVLIRFFSEHFSDVLCFFEYSYIMECIEYYPCGCAV